MALYHTLGDSPNRKLPTDSAEEAKEYFYDPLSRTLSPKSFGYKVSNALFIRSVAQIALRVTGAPRRKVYGSRI
jgi:hypothetical protein